MPLRVLVTTVTVPYVLPVYMPFFRAAATYIICELKKLQREEKKHVL
jgi:hypothetical protein